MLVIESIRAGIVVSVESAARIRREGLPPRIGRSARYRRRVVLRTVEGSEHEGVDMAMKAGMRRAALVAGLVLVAVTAASCGESSNASAPKSTTADGASSSTAQDPFCDKWVEVDGEGQKLSDPSVPPDVRTQAAGAVVAALDAAPAPDAAG